MTEDERESLRTPCWCPVCELVLRSGTGGDDFYYYKYKCCKMCFINFIEHSEDRWESGWRPSKEDIK